MGVERPRASVLNGTKVPANPFAEPVDVKPAPSPQRSKPLSIVAVQLLLTLQALAAILVMMESVQRGRTSALVFWVLSLLAVSGSAIVLGIQRRRRWAQIAMTTLLFCMTLFSVLIYLVRDPGTRWAQDLFRLRLPPSEHSPLGPVAATLPITLWACFGKRSREYFRTEASG